MLAGVIQNLKKIKQKKAVFLIFVLIVVAAIAVILFAINNKDTTDTGITITAQNENSLIEVDGSENIEDEEFDVSFFNSDGKLISKEPINEGDFVVPPKDKLVKDNYVFLGWNKSLRYIRGIMEVYPSSKYIGDTKNAIYSDAVYTRCRETVNPTIKLNGIVEINQLYLTIKYDPKVLKFIGSDAGNDHIVLNADEKKATIDLKLSSERKIEKEMILSELQFEVLESSAFYTELKIKVNEATVGNKNSAQVNADYTVVNGKINIY